MEEVTSRYLESTLITQVKKIKGCTSRDQVTKTVDLHSQAYKYAHI